MRLIALTLVTLSALLTSACEKTIRDVRAAPVHTSDLTKSV